MEFWFGFAFGFSEFFVCLGFVCLCFVCLLLFTKFYHVTCSMVDSFTKKGRKLKK